MRIVLFFAFFGHGLVSLGLSSSYTLHYNIIDAVNFSSIDTAKLLNIHAYLDIVIAFLLLFNFKMRQLSYFVLGYIFLIAISSLIFYWETTGSVFGISEFFRRLPWIFFLLFIISDCYNRPKYHYIRIGLSFAFISHGLASLGFMGFVVSIINDSGSL